MASQMVGTERSRGYRLELLCAGFLGGGRGDEFSLEGIWMVIYRLVHLLPREHPARLPQLARAGGPRRMGGPDPKNLGKIQIC